MATKFFDKIKAGVLGLAILFAFLSPITVSASIVPCGRSVDDKATSGINETHLCEFADVIRIINNLINYVILISAPIATIMFSYAGYEYLTAAGNSSKISRAHSIFWTVFVGFMIILAAWIIVKTLSKLVDPSFSQFLGN